MYPFNYHRPKSAEEAVALYRSLDDPAYLSGGHTLLPTMKQLLAAPTDLIDLQDVVELRGIEVSGNRVRIGAFTRHNDVAGSPDVRERIPALADLAGGIGDDQVRNCGTIGGSIANNDPAADYPAAVIALDATVYTPDRSIAGEAFFEDLFATALQPGELVTAVEFAIPDRAAYEKFPNPASRYAVAGVFVAEFGGDLRVAVTGAGPCAFRCPELEDALARGGDANGVTLDHRSFNTDLHASAEYRAHLVKVMATRAYARL